MLAPGHRALRAQRTLHTAPAIRALRALSTLHPPSTLRALRALSTLHPPPAPRARRPRRIVHPAQAHRALLQLIYWMTVLICHSRVNFFSHYMCFTSSTPAERKETAHTDLQVCLFVCFGRLYQGILNDKNATTCLKMRKKEEKSALWTSNLRRDFTELWIMSGLSLHCFY